MKRTVSVRITLYICIFLLVPHQLHSHNAPKLTIIFVVDQLAQHYFTKLQSHFRGGLKYLLENGVVYTNAHHPHGKPATATGHAVLNTGTYANDHGLTNNKWIDKLGNDVRCDDDDAKNAAVFSPDGTYKYGKSPHYIMVDGISEQFVLQSQPGSTHHVFSLSLKSRAAIATANKLGKAIWFDNQSGFFTSSKAYFDQLPNWLIQFNTEKKINTLKYVQWKKAYPRNRRAYNFYHTDNYQYTRSNHSFLNMKLPIDITTDPEGKDPYHFFVKTPHANQLLFDLAKHCIKTHISRKSDDRLLLWLCLSSLDKLGHQFGPEAMESIDMIYHLDKQIKRFLTYAFRAAGKNNTLMVLTSDHGISPIVELLHEQGMTSARRVNPTELLERINKSIEEKHDIPNLILGFKHPSFYLNMSLLKTFSDKKQQDIMQDLKTFLMLEPTIKHAWTYDELYHAQFETHSLENHFKKQLYPERSGQIIVQTHPYNIITKWKYGSTHKTPYACDTHVPLIVFQPGKFDPQRIQKRVWTTQLANTLADMLQVPQPSSSTADVLPGLV